MFIIHRQLCSLSEDGHRLITDASGVGLKPGEWPQSITVVVDNKARFLFSRPRWEVVHGEPGRMVYTAAALHTSFELYIINN
ncbi:MAG: hypothetical protein IMZ62_15645 [Chloroflexi bacterium]|nr:hypothetical protein [Chloroflexota bacterium]